MPQAVAEGRVAHMHASIRVARIEGLEGDVVGHVVLWPIHEVVFNRWIRAGDIVIEGGAHQLALPQQNVPEGAVFEVQQAPERHIKHPRA